MKIRNIFFIGLLIIIGACSSEGQSPSLTTIDPRLEELEEKVQQLETQLNATTLPTPPKVTAAPFIERTSRFISGYTGVDRQGNKTYECRHVDYYSDGTSYEHSRYWITEDQYRSVKCG